jgi:hypothetical protein
MMLEHQCSANFKFESCPSFVVHALSRGVVAGTTDTHRIPVVPGTHRILAARGRTQGSPLRAYRDSASNFSFCKKMQFSFGNTVPDAFSRDRKNTVWDGVLVYTRALVSNVGERS